MSITKVTFAKKRPDLKWDGTASIGYRIDVRIGGRRFRNVFATKSDASRFIEQLKTANVYKRAGLKTGRSPRVSELFAKRLAQIKDKRERVRGERIFAHFRSILDQDELVTSIRSVHFQLYINSREVKPETINREMTLLSTAFRRASEIFPTELEDYEPPRIVRPRFKQKRRERIVTPKENKLILDALYARNVRIARMWHIAWLLGLRYGEIAKLLKSDYKDRTLRVVRWKTATTTMFDYLPDEAIEVIESAIKESNTDFVFTLSGAPPKDFYPILRDTVQSVGLKWGREAITFHSLRHSFISRLIRVTDLATAKEFAGHSDATMTALYSHASDESKKRAMQQMYGQNLKKIYDKVRAGKMSFAEFCKSI